MADVLIKFTPTGVEETQRGISTIGDRLEKLGTVGEGANRGIRTVESALFDLSARASDLGSGPIARLTEGLALFAGGSPYVLGITAGLGLIGAGYRALSSDTDAATKSAKEYTDALAKLAHAETISPQTARASTIQSGRGELAAAQAELARLRGEQASGLTQVPDTSVHWYSALTSLQGFAADEGHPFGIGATIPITRAIAEQQARVATLTAQAREAGGGPIQLPPVTAITTEEAEERRRARIRRIDEDALRDQEAYNAPGFGGRTGFGYRAAPPSSGDFGIRYTGFGPAPRPGIGDYGAFGPADGLDPNLYRDFSPDGDARNPREPRTDWRRIVGAGVGLAGAGRGGPAPFLAAAGGIAAAAGQPEVGGLIEGLSSLFSDGKAKVTVEAYGEQALQQERDLRGDPLTTSVAILGDSRGIAYSIDRDAERGVLPRGI